MSSIIVKLPGPNILPPCKKVPPLNDIANMAPVKIKKKDPSKNKYKKSFVFRGKTNKKNSR